MEWAIAPVGPPQRVSTLPERPQVLTVAAVLPAVALLAVAGIALLQLQAAAPVLAGAGEAGAGYPGATCGEKDADRRPPRGGDTARGLPAQPGVTATRCRSPYWQLLP